MTPSRELASSRLQYTVKHNGRMLFQVLSILFIVLRQIIVILDFFGLFRNYTHHLLDVTLWHCEFWVWSHSTAVPQLMYLRTLIFKKAYLHVKISHVYAYEKSINLFWIQPQNDGFSFYAQDLPPKSRFFCKPTKLGKTHQI